MDTLITLLLMGVVVAIAFIFAKITKRGRTSAAEREQKASALLANAKAEARGAPPKVVESASPRMVAVETAAPVSAQVTDVRDINGLMSDFEMLLYRRLIEALPALLVFPKVNLLHVPGVVIGATDSVDFLICHGDDSRVMVAIEMENDQDFVGNKKNALDRANIPLVVLNGVDLPDVAGLRKLLAPHLAEWRRRSEKAETSSN